MSSLFTEKYRPKTWEDLYGNSAEISRIKAMVEKGTISHCIFEGTQPGTGKTSTALLISKILFKEFYKQNTMELNASDDRGIDVVRDKIIDFAKMSPLNSKFKICILDEADGVTAQAQNALRRPMEKYGEVTRFILCCNDASKIIEPIQSRCEVFHFSPLGIQDIASRVKQVAQKENLNIDEDAIIFLAEKAEGDMRKALNKLQVLSSYGCSIDKKLISSYEKSSNYCISIIDSLQQGRFLEARRIVQDNLVLGLNERDIIQDLHKSLVGKDNFPKIQPLVKGECIKEIAETDYRLTQGVSKGLQLDALLLKLLKILKV